MKKKQTIPMVMQSISRKEPSDKQSAILTNEFCKELNRKKICVIDFVSKSSEEIVLQLQNRQASGHRLVGEIIEYNETSSFWEKERSQEGLCLMSNGCIPNTHGKDFLQQTLILRDYTEQVLPELVKSRFWQSCKFELKHSEEQLKNLLENCNVGSYANATQKHTACVQQLQKLKINKYFRPKFVDVLQQVAANDFAKNTRIYQNDHTLTNSMGEQKGSFVSAGYFDEYGLDVLAGRSVKGCYAEVGCSFICNLNFLLSVI